MQRIDMLRRAACQVGLSAMGLLLGIGPQQSATATEPPKYAVISRGEAAGPYQAFPDVCRLPGGDLACVFYCRLRTRFAAQCRVATRRPHLPGPIE